MIRIQGSKSAICTKKEVKMMNDLGLGLWHIWIYELPLFDLKPKAKLLSSVNTEYVLVKTNDNKLTQTFFDRINKTWNKLYEN